MGRRLPLFGITQNVIIATCYRNYLELAIINSAR